MVQHLSYCDQRLITGRCHPRPHPQPPAAFIVLGCVTELQNTYNTTRSQHRMLPPTFPLELLSRCLGFLDHDSKDLLAAMCVSRKWRDAINPKWFQPKISAILPDVLASKFAPATLVDGLCGCGQGVGKGGSCDHLVFFAWLQWQQIRSDGLAMYADKYSLTASVRMSVQPLLGALDDFFYKNRACLPA